MADSAARPRSRLPMLVLVAALAALLVVIAVKFRSVRERLAEARSDIVALDESLRALRSSTEVLVRERAQASLERDEERERADELAARLASETAALAEARAQLASARAERDDHLAVRLELEARLEAAYDELAR